MRQTIRDLVAAIEPFDELEATHQQDVLAWIDSGAPLFRMSKPDNPPKHLVSYFVLYDEMTNQFMLINHLKAKLLLPTGGHIEVDEDPQATVTREADEELGIEANFSTSFGQKPLFITVTVTKGNGQHIDVSLWYIVRGNSQQQLAYDQGEMSGYQWLTPDEILAKDIHLLDPEMHRFVRKFHHTMSKFRFCLEAN
jgi:8-oxo-dGTP pyrophosphatase MutT (NUDIX family)